MTNEKTKYMEKLAKFVIGEEMKVKRTKGEKDKTKPLGVGHLSDEAKGTSVKEGKRDYASGTISKAAEGRKVDWLAVRELQELLKLLQGLDKHVGNSAILERLIGGEDSTFNNSYNNLRWHLEETIEEIKNK